MIYMKNFIYIQVRSLPGVDRAVGEGDRVMPIAAQDEVGFWLPMGEQSLLTLGKN